MSPKKRVGTGRPTAGYGDVGRDLHRLLGEERPPWVSEAAQEAARALLEALRADAAAATAGKNTLTAPAALGVSRMPFMRWRRPGGWLHGL